MALKDLLASKSAIEEEVIEQIISDFVRFDPDQKEVVFTPSAYGISNKSKILIYLVALQGWPYVTDEMVPEDAKPGEIEEQTGIAGGSLRPILKDLKDRNIISEKGGRYSIRAVALSAVQVELNAGGSPAEVTKPKRRRDKNKNSLSEDQNFTEAVSEKYSEKSEEKPKKSRTSTTSGVSERFQLLIEGGFFDEPKALSDLKRHLHKQAIIVPSTSLPSYLLKAVRSGQLERDKQIKDGKELWMYRRSN